MTAATHKLGGILLGMAIAVPLHSKPLETAVITFGALLGSIVPDIDNWNSSISHRWRLLSSLITVCQQLLRTLSELLPGKAGRYIRSLAGHRGITHSIVAVLIPFSMYFMGINLHWAAIPCLLLLGMTVGIVSHLILDIFSGGVPLAMPFSTRRITLAGIKTGGMAEWGCRTVLLLIIVWQIIRYLQSLYIAMRPFIVFA